MGWSWAELCATPMSVVREAAWQMREDQKRQSEARSRMRRR